MFVFIAKNIKDVLHRGKETRNNVRRTLLSLTKSQIAVDRRGFFLSFATGYLAQSRAYRVTRGFP